MPSKPVLSDTDKENIRKRLKELCEECWITQGYKKTSIKSLCEKAGISVGTFYTLYPTICFLKQSKPYKGGWKKRFLRLTGTDGQRTDLPNQ